MASARRRVLSASANFPRFDKRNCLQLLNTPLSGDNWEEGLSEMQLTPDGNIMTVAGGRHHHNVLPGIEEESETADDSSERISRLEI